MLPMLKLDSWFNIVPINAFYTWSRENNKEIYISYAIDETQL